ncbi:MAG: hypothetical protein HC871_00765 [Rhizobiales bacterium]|nr:hypothetical protein [Hyphomicrobiales bacterium]
MGYISDHWHGRHGLTRAFWINFLAPFVLTAAGVSWFGPAGPGHVGAEAIAAGLYLLLAYGIILPWQLIGLWRSSRRHLREQGDSTTITFVQSAALLALVTAAGITATAAERIFEVGSSAAKSPAGAPRYVLTYLPDERIIQIDGPFDVGLSRDLRAMLAAGEDIEAVVLDSDAAAFSRRAGSRGRSWIMASTPMSSAAAARPAPSPSSPAGPESSVPRAGSASTATA